MVNPKVFISHASEDKDRFVNSFVKKLEQNGVDAWLDNKKMLPGDSLIDKIFEEGIKDSKAVIIVLSKASVNKPWVKEELNASFVKRVKNESKLIPVIIEDCIIPECLQSTVWIRINDIFNYENELNRIIQAILGTIDKPELGELPKYAQNPIKVIGGLSEIDSLVFKTACDLMLETNRTVVYTKDLLDRLKGKDISKETMLESLYVLIEEYYIEKSEEFGELNYFVINHHSFHEYALECLPDFENTYNDIKYFIVNGDRVTNEDIHIHFKIPIVLVDHLLEDLNNENLITLLKYLGGSVVQEYSPRLKREIQ